MKAQKLEKLIMTIAIAIAAAVFLFAEAAYADGQIYAISMGTNSRLWTQNYATGAITAIATDGPYVIAGDSSGNVHLMWIGDGYKYWTKNPSTGAVTGVDINYVDFGGDTHYEIAVSDEGGNVHYYYNGTLLWTRKYCTGVATGVVFTYGGIAVCDEAGNVHWMDMNGNKSWTKDYCTGAATAIASNSFASGDRIVVGDEAGNVHFLSWQGGKQWTKTYSTTKITGAAVVEGSSDGSTYYTVYWCDEAGNIHFLYNESQHDVVDYCDGAATDVDVRRGIAVCDEAGNIHHMYNRWRTSNYSKGAATCVAVTEEINTGDGTYDCYVFVGDEGLYPIKGFIRYADGGAAIEGVQISAGGKTDITDASGAYEITELRNGTYEITALKTDYSFSPATATVKNAAKDVDFYVYTISGDIRRYGTDTGIGGLNVVIKKDGLPIDTVQTNESGYYQKYVGHAGAGTYTIEATNPAP